MQLFQDALRMGHLLTVKMDGELGTLFGTDQCRYKDEKLTREQALRGFTVDRGYLIRY